MMTRTPATPWHPLFFAAYAVLALLAANRAQVEYTQALRPLALSLAAAGLLVLVLRWIFNEWQRAGVVATLAVILFFSYGHVYHLIEGHSLLGITYGRHRYLAPLWSAVLLAGAWILHIKAADLRGLSRTLNLVAGAAVLLPAATLLGYALTGLANPAGPATADESLGARPGAIAPAHTPDIYLIIMDGYARQDTLQQVYDFDNRPFLDRLAEMGFFVAPQSHSNYSQTVLSVAALMNYDYLEGILSEIEPSTSDLRPLTARLKQGRILEQLRRLGYSVVAVGSGYNPTELTEADHYLALNPFATQAQDLFGGLTLFEGMLIQTSAASLALDAISAYSGSIGATLEQPYRSHRQRILYAFETLEAIPAAYPGPKIVFVHIVSPHPPFVFGPDGEELPHAQVFTLKDGVFSGSRPEYIRQYVDQLTFLNHKLEDSLRSVLSAPGPAPLIILVSDHGSDATAIGQGSSGFSYPRERMSNLTAIHLGDCPAEELYPSVTPVNIFRIVLRACFGGDVELLEDRVFLSAYGSPFELSDVTEQVR
jgi:hypothetical protein